MRIWGQWIGTITDIYSTPPHIRGAILNIDKDRPKIGKFGIYYIEGSDTGSWMDVVFKEPVESTVCATLLGEDGNQIGEMAIKLGANNCNDHIMQGDVTGGAFRSGKTIFELQRAEDDRPSQPNILLQSWDEYKSWLFDNSKNDLIYRGQRDCTKRLTTTFHRTQRCDLYKYAEMELQELNRYLAGVLDRSFNDSFGNIDSGALLNLAQHHGFPTPMLDWTESPYIAAYFAFCDIPKDKLDGNVRIFSFDKEMWAKDAPKKPDWNCACPLPFLKVEQLMPLLNARALPQQSIVTTTNVRNIENLLNSKESEGRRYLTKIDLPAAERNRVMGELSWMGITAAALFPGVEGTCKALKEKFF